MFRKFLCFLIPAYLSMSALITSTKNGEGSWIKYIYFTKRQKRKSSFRVKTNGDGERINSWLRYWVVMAAISLPGR